MLYCSAQVALQLYSCPFTAMVPLGSDASSQRLLPWQDAPSSPWQLVVHELETEFHTQFKLEAALHAACVV